MKDKKPFDKYAEVAVEVPVEGTFTYGVSGELAEDVVPGKRVLVPFGRRTVTGYVVSTPSTTDLEGVKPVSDVLDNTPVFDPSMLRFYRWVSDYYFAPLGEVLSLIHPGGTNIRSLRRIKRRPGAEAPEGLGELERKVLRASSKGATVSTLARRFRGRPLMSAVERLKRAGLVDEETVMRGGHTVKTEKVASALPLTKGGAEEELLKGSPLQARVYEYLKESGPTALKALRDEFSGSDGAVRRLAEKGLVEVSERHVYRDPLSNLVPRPSDFTPNPEQKKAIEAIGSALAEKTFSPFLLYGVTGSGKTLVYLRVLEQAIRLGRKAVVLTPEIALTPWPAAYLAEKFPGRVALAHSGLSDGERYDEWRRVVSGEVDIVVGARSALFSPLRDLGLIIVDEEHETSYKQEDGVRYNARDAALMLGKYIGATVVLGSATPSVETYSNSLAGRVTPLTMKKRVKAGGLPEVELVDMRKRKKEVLSEELKAELGRTLDRGGQALLFINRRGYSNFLICGDCGHTPSCTNCSVTLTVHRGSGVLKCHYCDLTTAIPDECPECRGPNLRTPGHGTERVEQEVLDAFPGARTIRMDRDTTRKKGSVEEIIGKVERKEVDVLVGTQMVSKGHHFPGIALVGVISGDTSLNIPDFRSSERTFQLLTQAAGRAGRDEATGKVMVQTLNPDHYCLRRVLTHDYEGFYREEASLREEVSYPPYSRLCCLRLDAPKEALAAEAAELLGECAEGARRAMKARGAGIMVLGPAPALVAKLKGRHRWNLLVKCADARTLHTFVSAVRKRFEKARPSKVVLAADMDPVSVA